MRNSSGLAASSVYITMSRPPIAVKTIDSVFERESKTGNFNYQAYREAHVLLIGAGGLGGLIGLGLVRKAIGKLTICDGDTVELSNLNRQRFFFGNVGKPKASELAKNLRQEAVAVTRIKAINLYFEEAVAEKLVVRPTLCICVPDNDEVRQYATKYFYDKKIALITSGLSEDSDYGYCFVQDGDPQRGCWSCLRKGSKGKKKCGVAANMNLPMLITGIVLTACDTLISGQSLKWNYRRLSLSGDLPDVCLTVPRWPECAICGDAESIEG